MRQLFSYYRIVFFSLWRVILLLKMAGNQLCKQYLTLQEAVDDVLVNRTR